MMKRVSVMSLVMLSLSEAVRLNGWEKVKAASSEELVRMVFPVKQSNLSVVESMFWEVSSPGSPMYGKFLSFDEIGELTKNEIGTQSTLAYLQSIGVDKDAIKVNPHGTFVSAHVPIGLANKVFAADFHVYTHAQAKSSIVKTESLTLPEELKTHVTHVPHVSFFPSVQTKFATATSSGNYVTPQLLANYYGIDNSQVSYGATQSLFEALGQMFDDTDLNTFQKQFGITAQNISMIIGNDIPTECFSSTGSENCGEANLDVQYIMAIAQGADTVYWNIDSSSSDPFLDWAEQLTYYSQLPQVHSISYGGYEDTSNDDMNTFNTEVQKLGLQGISVIVSSGDDGAANSGARSDASQCGYHASFPASSPYVTAVGATQGPESGNEEVVCSSATGGVITSGGGFSDVFSQPSYQSSQVSDYFNNVANYPVSGFNSNGRGYPDVSVMGYNYVVAIGGKFTLESGTSASAPVFAGMVTLINDARLAAGKSPLGFLNQALYSLDSSVWNDITSGDNTCTANPQICCQEGFSAAQGWDPVSGLGTPNFRSLMQALVSL
eukprot:TRINITY_DN107_c0_g2_i1.p1 TRINITY_DN107_c0_g2~~TRINITY_DN107_c0_g2_i1.p1  ORF type:complete len:551 (-),score=161.18 TRINITY_DN107_c0_g2_i1:47-1699(-)